MTIIHRIILATAIAAAVVPATALTASPAAHARTHDTQNTNHRSSEESNHKGATKHARDEQQTRRSHIFGHHLFHHHHLF